MQSIVPQTCIKLVTQKIFSFLFDSGNIDTLDDYFMLSFYALICFHQFYAAGTAAKGTLIRKKDSSGRIGIYHR